MVSSLSSAGVTVKVKPLTGGCRIPARPSLRKIRCTGQGEIKVYESSTFCNYFFFSNLTQLPDAA